MPTGYFLVPDKVAESSLFCIEIIDLYHLASLDNPIQTTTRELATRWGCTKDHVVSLLNKLTTRGWATIDKSRTKGTQITVLDVSTNSQSKDKIPPEAHQEVTKTSPRKATVKKERALTKKERIGEPPTSEDAAKNPLPEKLIKLFESQEKQEYGINVWLTKREHDRLMAEYGEDLTEFLYGQMSQWSVSSYQGARGVGWKTYREHDSHYQTIINLAPRWIPRYNKRNVA